MEIKDIAVSVERMDEVRGGAFDAIRVAQNQTKGDVVGTQYVSGPAFSVDSPIYASNLVSDNSLMSQGLNIETNGHKAFNLTGNVLAGWL